VLFTIYLEAIYILLLLLIFASPDSLLLFDLPLLLGNIFSVFDPIYIIYPFKGTEVDYVELFCCVHLFANFFGTFV
jgi:hypothetical protein